MTEKEMQIMLGKHFGIKNICIPNVLMTGEYRPEIEKLESWKKSSKMYEADFIYITKSGYLTEVEIKVDINDFRSDFKKKIYHSSQIVSALYYECKVKTKAPKRKNIKALTDTQIKDFMRIGCMKWFKE